MKTKTDYLKLAKAFFEGMSFEKIKPVRATIYLDENQISKGSATVSDDSLIFHPEIPQRWDSSLRGVISLTVEGTEPAKRLRRSEWFDDSSSMVQWYFEIEK